MSPVADISLLAIFSCDLPPLPVGSTPAMQSIQWQLLSPQPAAELTVGSAVTAYGSPFGASAPQHFANSCTTGIVSQVLKVALGLLFMRTCDKG